MSDAKALLRKHFPGTPESLLDFHSEFLEMRFPLAGGIIPAAQQKVELERVERIKDLINKLWKEFHALPLTARRIAPDNLWMRLLVLTYDMTGKSPISRYDKIYKTKLGALDEIRGELNDHFSMHHTQRDAEFPAKVQLVTWARETWQSCKGKSAPRYANTANPFFKFVEDIILFLSKDWGTEKTLAAWRKFSDSKVNG